MVGSAAVKADSKAEAIARAREFLDAAGNGECEILELHEEAAFGPE